MKSTKIALYALTSAAVGAALVYALDPVRGRSRRAQLRDKSRMLAHKSQEALNKDARDLRNRLTGKVAEVKASFRKEQVPDHRLRERVRSAIGRAVSNPHAIDVEVHDARVLLRGPVLEAEAENLIDTAAHVRGVRAVTNQLEVHRAEGHVPALQHTEEHMSEQRRKRRSRAPWPALSGLAALGVGGMALAGFSSKKGMELRHRLRNQRPMEKARQAMRHRFGFGKEAPEEEGRYLH